MEYLVSSTIKQNNAKKLSLSWGQIQNRLNTQIHSAKKRNSQQTTSATLSSKMEAQNAWKIFITMAGGLLLIFLMLTTLLLTNLQDFPDPAFSLVICCVVVFLLFLLSLGLVFWGRKLEGRLLTSCSLLLLTTTSCGLLIYLLITSFPASTAPVLLALAITTVTLLLTTSIAYCGSLSPLTWSTWLLLLSVFSSSLLLLLALDAWLDQDYLLLHSPWDVLYGGLVAMYLLIFIHLGTYKLLKDGRFQDTANINLILLSAFIFLLVAVVTIVGMAVG